MSTAFSVTLMRLTEGCKRRRSRPSPAGPLKLRRVSLAQLPDNPPKLVVVVVVTAVIAKGNSSMSVTTMELGEFRQPQTTRH